MTLSQNGKQILSLYCGAGGIDEGLKQCGIKTTLAIDSDRDCCNTMKLNHPDTEVICGKVEDYQESLSNFDIIVGGPPCPEFSNAKTGRTYDTKEVDIFWNIVERNQPKYYLMENVPNIIKVLKREPNFIIDSSDYGVPQQRKRRFYTNIPLPKPTFKISPKEILGVNGHISNSGFSKCNQYCISRPVDQPCKTLVIAGTLRLTDKPVYSKKYPELPQDYKIIRKFTNEELKLLQGFPKHYQFYGNSQSVKKQICNAVPCAMVKELFSQIVLDVTH